MKKVLFVATVVQKHINVFHTPFLELFQNEGYETHVASSNDTGCADVSISNCDVYTEIGFKRNPLHPSNFLAYLKMKKLLKHNFYDIIHCHTPVGALVGRLAARPYRKKGTKVYYTAHGFHFYKGAPLLNWLLYYPVEKLCSRFTDVLITINQEDYALATKKMKAGRVEYVPGVGVDLSKVENLQVNRSLKRQELGIPEEAFLVLSVGELNDNKNHQVVIRALAELDDPNVHYAIAGDGDKKDFLIDLVKELGVSERVHFLGYRKDVLELYRSSDLFAFPSFREGLSVALMEAMACGMPVVCTKIRGNEDLIDTNGGVYFDPASVSSCQKALEVIMASDTDAMKAYNTAKIKRFALSNILKEMRRIYDLP